MNNQIQKAGWLVMAAALMIGMAACSNDDDKVPEHPDVATPPRVSTVHIAVEASLNVEYEIEETRSDVDVEEDFETEKPRRTLKFTTGDKLFVFAKVKADYNYFLAGTLSIVASSIDDDRKTASFTGDLQVYNFEGSTPEPSSYAFTDADPLNECKDHSAYLIAKDMVEGFYTIENLWNFKLDYTKSIVVDDPDDDSDDCVSTLMKTALKVRSYRCYKTEYDGDPGPKMFRGFMGAPILDCTISGLTSGRAYTVTLLEDGNESYYSHSGSIYSLTYATRVTADDSGTAHFAISLDENRTWSDCYWSLKLECGGETRYVMLGQKESIETNKVYRVNREATE